MIVTHNIAECRAGLAGLRQGRRSIGFVPTMGALHDGHIALVRAAQSRADRVAVSIFVNPTQFENPADLEKYPRTEKADLDKLRAASVDLVFLPSVDEIYPEGNETIVEVTGIGNRLHGALRPGHYRGVTSVVARLFNIFTPQIAAFGEKDYQQLQIIKRMVRDLAFPIEIVGVPTLREADGLAMSSRNVRLTALDRAAAVVLARALDAAEALANKTVENIAQTIATTITAEPRAALRGLDIVTAEELLPVSGALTAPVAVMISVAFGDILLIDQRVIEP